MFICKKKVIEVLFLLTDFAGCCWICFFLQLAKFHSNSECICIYKLFDSIGLIKISKPKKLELVDINRYIRTNVLELLVSIRQPMKSPSKDPNIRIRVNTFYHPWLICFCVMQCVAFQLLVANTLSFEKNAPHISKQNEWEKWMENRSHLYSIRAPVQ